MVLQAGLLYTLGRCLLYLSLATLLTTSALSIPAVSVILPVVYGIGTALPVLLCTGGRQSVQCSFAGRMVGSDGDRVDFYTGRYVLLFTVRV